ncbi:helicase protein [Ancylostoma caninum]|uniref:ATP-dependent RNA helicase n=1 Tax=Ancylostoma caninum TaxID=29170 RepID=A0A368FBD8_ANCCA|nr:helicase protein [Ancylostoma caninum]
MTTIRRTAFILRRFSSAQPSAKFNPNKFGSLQQSDIRVEWLSYPKSQDFEFPVSKRKVKELSVPISLSRSKREQLEKLQSREPPPPAHLCFIQCSRPEFNLLESNPSINHSLCSKYWEKNKYSDDWFVIKRTTKEAPSQFARWANAWEHYVPDRLDPLIREVIADLGLKTPTYVQTQCLQVFPSRYHLFIAAETGSGKTIAYAAPLLTRLLQRRRKGNAEKGNCNSCRYRLVKGADFCCLVKARNKNRFESVDVLNGSKYLVTGFVAFSWNDWDILVGTPGLVEKCLRNRGNGSDVKHLILDEADMILDESFTDVLTEIFALIPIANSVTNADTNTEDESNGARVIFCSASCPEELECLADGVVDRQFLRYIKSPKLHSLSHNVEMKFIRVREKDKITRLTELLSEDMKRGDLNQTIVFCKDRATASFVRQQLQSFEHNVALWKSPLPHEDESRIFIATDVAARGIDLPRLSHVINYDLSRHAVDFLHRIGRVGRLSSTFLGRVTSFVRTTSEVRLTNVIELAARLGRPLSNIEAEFKRRDERRTITVARDSVLAVLNSGVK